MSGKGAKQTAAPSPARSGESGQSDDSKRYEGVYYGSGSSDEEDLNLDSGDANNNTGISDALLGELGEPDENEEPYDILVDNGEFLYGEEDRRQYISVAATAPSAAAMDLMLSGAEASISNTMASISEDDGEEEEDAVDAGRAIGASTPKKSNRSSANARDIVFRPKRGGQQPRPPSPPTPMYQMPKDYKVPSPSYEDDIADDRSASSSIATGSIKKLVRDIDGVLDDMNPRIDPQEATGTPNDDDSIATDMSVGATTRLSGELDRAQEVFWEFTGIDATGQEKRKKNKKKAKALGSQPSNDRTATNNSQQAQGEKKSTIFLLFASYAIFIGILVAIFIVLRSNRTKTETSAATSAISGDSISSLAPTISPNDDLIMLNPGSSKTRIPAASPTTASPTTASPTTANPTTARPSSAPSLRPTQKFWIDPDELPSLTVKPTLSIPAPSPVKKVSRIPETRSKEEDPPVDATKVGGEHSFPVPDSSSNTRPWDDDNYVEGHDDFYSTDDEYEYERHHPNQKSTKEGKHHGKQKVQKASKEEQKADKSSKVSKTNHMDPSPQQQTHRQWQQQIASNWDHRTSHTRVAESLQRIRVRQRPARGGYYL